MDIDINNFDTYGYSVVRNFLFYRTYSFQKTIHLFRCLSRSPEKFYSSIFNYSVKHRVNVRFILDCVANKVERINNPEYTSEYFFCTDVIRDTMLAAESRDPSYLLTSYFNIYYHGRCKVFGQEALKNHIREGDWVPEGVYIKIEPEADIEDIAAIVKMIKEQLWRSEVYKDAHLKFRHNKGWTSNHIRNYIHLQSIIERNLKETGITDIFDISDKFFDIVGEAIDDLCINLNPHLTDAKYKNAAHTIKIQLDRLTDRYHLPQLKQFDTEL